MPALPSFITVNKKETDTMPNSYDRLIYDQLKVALLVTACDAIIHAADSFEPSADYDGHIAAAVDAARVALAHMTPDSLAAARRDAPRAVARLVTR
jgi:hypothetical protein